MSRQTPAERIAELEELLRQHREATRSAAETAQLVIERLEQADKVVQAAQDWRHASEADDAIVRVVRASRTLRDAVDEYERSRKRS